MKKRNILIIFLILIIFTIGIITTVLLSVKKFNKTQYYTVKTNYIYNNETFENMSFEIFSTNQHDYNLDKENIKEVTFNSKKELNNKLTLLNIVKNEGKIINNFTTLYKYDLNFVMLDIKDNKYKIYEDVTLNILTNQNKTISLPIGNIQIINNQIFEKNQYIQAKSIGYDKLEIKEKLQPKNIKLSLKEGFSVEIKGYRFGFLDNELLDFEKTNNDITLTFKKQHLYTRNLTIFFVLNKDGKQIYQRLQYPFTYTINYIDFFDKANELKLLSIQSY